LGSAPAPGAVGCALAAHCVHHFRSLFCALEHKLNDASLKSGVTIGAQRSCFAKWKRLSLETLAPCRLHAANVASRTHITWRVRDSLLVEQAEVGRLFDRRCTCGL